MTSKEFALPDVGEGLREAEIVTWRVAVGDLVEVNQALVEIETAKSLVELPSPYAGEVAELLAAEGEMVDVGRPIVRISSAQEAEVAEVAEVDEAQPALLVGYGPSTSTRRRRRVPAQAPVVEKSTPAVVHERPRAKPPIRKLAKDLGVDLRILTPTGPDRTITRTDVTTHADQGIPRDQGTPHDHGIRVGAGIQDDVRIPVRGVRRATAAAMVTSAFTAPHVTEFLTVEVSRTMELRGEVARRREFAGSKLSPLVFVARAFLTALRRTPEANARWGDDEIVQFRSVNLGFAAATPRGLVVPNIKDAQDLSLAALGSAINELAATARDGRTTPEALTGGTITITNVGMFGVDTGTPILNPGEAAILALGAIRRMPWVVGEGDEERIEPRWVTQLALSFDHRVLDGEQGSRLLADTAAILHEPGLALL